MHLAELLFNLQAAGGDHVLARLQRGRDQFIDRDRGQLVQRAVLGACEHEEAVQQPVGLVQPFAKLRVKRAHLG